MIKGSSFLKSFVLGLFTLGISYFTFGVNYSSSQYIRDINVWGYNPYAQSYNINITRNGTFLSETLGTTRPIFMINGNSAFFRTVNGIPYFVGVDGAGRNIEGFIQQYYVCSLEGESTTNCQLHEVGTNTATLFSNFLNSVSDSDIFSFEVSEYAFPQVPGSRTRCTIFNLGISSQSLGTVLVFSVGSDTYGLSCSNCVCSSNYHSSLTGSWSISSYQPDIFSNIPSAFLSYPPSVGGSLDSGNNQISSGSGSYSQLTGNIVYVPGSVCTNGRAKNWYESNGMSLNSCYTYYSESNYITGLAGYEPGMSVDSLWRYTSTLRWSGSTGSFMEFDKWFSFWSYAYDTYKRGIHTWSELYTNVPNAIPGYFARIYGSSWSDKEYVDYCNIVLSDASYLNSSYTGVNYNSVCGTTIGNGTDDEDWTNPFPPGGGAGGGGGSSWGDTPAGIDWNGFGGQTNNGGSSSESGLNELQDGTSFISNSYNELKKEYRIPNKSDFGFGILPGYIIWALIGIIIFRFLSH